MTRAHPYVLDGTRLIVPLYSDGFNFSLMAITDDWGATWKTSTPLVGVGNIQPSLARKKDGTLVAYMRDNGPPPKRLHVSRVARPRRDVERGRGQRRCPNPGSGAEVLELRNGHWVLVCNDIERAATAWRWRSPTTRARRGRGRGIWSATARRRRRARRVSLSVDHPGEGRARCTRPTAISCRRRRRGWMRRTADAQGDQARALRRSVDPREASMTSAAPRRWRA